MSSLDRSRPYAEVWGAGLECLVQDGRRFSIGGEPLDSEPVVAPPAPAAPEADPGDERHRLAAEAEGLGIDVDHRWGAARLRREIVKLLPARPDGDTVIGGMSDDELRVMVEVAGGTWTDRAAALAMLADGDK